MESLSQFTNLYQVSKTLKFELKPVGKTLEWINKKGLLQADEHRSESYQKVKKIIDEYHKAFIEDSLNAMVERLKRPAESKTEKEQKADSAFLQSLQLVADYKDKTEKADKDKVKKAQEELRKYIAGAFNMKDISVLIKDILPATLEDEENIKLVEEFKDYTTYFDGYKDNRKNMYVADEKSTAIAYRLVNDNLPKYLANIKTFDKIAESLQQEIAQLESDFADRLEGKSLEYFFGDVLLYPEFFTQSRIELYNQLIGGLNEYINRYNQQHKDARLPKFVVLFKQILADREMPSWIPDEFRNDTELLDCIQQVYDNFQSEVLNPEEGVDIESLLQHLDDYDLGGIYVKNDVQLTSLMKSCYGDWGILQRALEAAYDAANPLTKNTSKAREAHLKKRAEHVKSFESFSLADINHYVGQKDRVEDYLARIGASEDRKSILETINDNYEAIRELLLTPADNKLRQHEQDIQRIKAFLDSLKDLQHFVKVLEGTGSEGGRDQRFYSDLEAYSSVFEQVTSLYTMVRNYLTKKPYSEEKIKLRFENKGDFLGGWVDSKTDNSDNGTQYGGYLFRKRNSINEYDYYIGISANKKLFRKDETVRLEKDSFERLDYYQLKKKSFYGSSYVGIYETDKDALRVSLIEFLRSDVDGSKYSIDEKATPLSIIKMVAGNEALNKRLFDDKAFLQAYGQLKGNLLATLAKMTRVPDALALSKREDISLVELEDGIEEIVKNSQFHYFPVSAEAINEAMESENKTLYLFKICNKDLSFAETFDAGKRKSRGTENLHTMYFKALFEEGQNVLDLGTAEIFYRKGTDFMDEKHKKYGYHYEKLKDKFSYPIYKNRRYASDKFLLHISMILNYQQGKDVSIDHQVRQFIHDGGIRHIIGIDRGERHLLYLSMIDLEGNIVKQFTLNKIINEYKGQTFTKNYRDLLAVKEKERDEQRRSWKSVENIKELKEGYLSQVIHVISKLMVEYQAIVVLEDLNGGFKRGRQKVESSVYQQFEKKLIDKLNYLADKQRAINEEGGILHAYQLASTFKSFQKLGKQSGFLFYIPAWNTSKIDPVTGFVNYINTKYESVEKSRALFEKFADIRYNAEKGYFEFVIDDYSAFNPKAEGTRLDWVLCTKGTRIRTFRNAQKNNEWDSEQVDLTAYFEEFFAKQGISYGSHLKEAILEQDSKDFFEGLHSRLALLLQLRNSRTGSEEDYILSPVANSEGVFYDSRCYYQDEAAILPRDADANGAYNIARKGLMLVSRMQEQDADLKKLDMKITNEQWLCFAQYDDKKKV